MKTDIYERITADIVAQLERGTVPWHQPWQVEHSAGRISRPLRANGIPYQGINVVVLWSSATAQGYAAPIWITFKQALDLGAHVKKGEKGTPVVYADKISRSETEPSTGEETVKAIPFLKSYTVFNAEQVDGLPTHFYAEPPQRPEPLQRIQRADAFFAATRANIVHGGDRASYGKGSDTIHLPLLEFFRDAESYYATLAHEMTHWTRHETRLARDLGRKRWGDRGYAMEELVAELGAAFLCCDLDLTPEPREDHAAYIAHWIHVLKQDSRAIFTAAAHAQRAAEFLHKLQPQNAAAAA